MRGKRHKYLNFNNFFNLKDFLKEAEEIYKSAFQALANRDKILLQGLVTESAFYVNHYNYYKKYVF